VNHFLHILILIFSMNLPNIIFSRKKIKKFNFYKCVDEVKLWRNLTEIWPRQKNIAVSFQSYELVKPNLNSSVPYLIDTRNSSVRVMLLKIMHESWVEYIQRVVCHIFRTVHAYRNSTGIIVCWIYIFFLRMEIFILFLRSPLKQIAVNTGCMTC
jgi:uncharacterized membrane-anchored protein YitT (DUF2179 family)